MSSVRRPCGTSDGDADDAPTGRDGGGRGHRRRPADRPPAFARTRAMRAGWRSAGAGYEVSWRMSARRAARKSCRAVSRSTRRMGAPQRGHGHDARGAAVAGGSAGGGGATASA